MARVCVCVVLLPVCVSGRYRLVAAVRYVEHWLHYVRTLHRLHALPGLTLTDIALLMNVNASQ